MGYQSKLESEELNKLFSGILQLKDKEDCYKFFEDLCTIKEMKDFGTRFQVANLLYEKKTYSEIEKITKVSTATISRINKCLHYGNEGYSTIIERLKEKQDGE